MAGYCIRLFKYMRIDENIQKQERLLSNRKMLLDQEGNVKTPYFLTYGEFDRIGFDRVTQFSRFRDISPDAKTWMGDRQTLLVYDIPENEYEDAVFYKNGDFYIKDGDKDMRSDQLFIGVTILQFKDSQKKKQEEMGSFLEACKKEILKLTKETMPGIACSVFGTLGSFGLTIIWLADQYTDILSMVTRIRKTDVGGGTSDINKSIFLSAYTIFAQNHQYGAKWEEKIKDIKGEAILHLTLKRSVSGDILDTLRKWQIEKTEIYHSAGEHDIVIRVETKKIYSLFNEETALKIDGPFVKDNVLQSNLQLCEDVKDDQYVKSISFESSSGENANTGSGMTDTGQEAIPELEEIQQKYRDLRQQFKDHFPSTAGMVDSLDWLYGDYIAKISTASNEMWVSNFSYQFLKILNCISGFMEELEKKETLRQNALETINDLLGKFERQISHIAESNNLILGTPICQFRYSGQNNLTFYAYFGIIKSILNMVYKNQEVSSQAEIVPLLAADIVPIIKSNLFIDYNNKNDTRIITFNLPMMSLYNPISYYPFLVHEIFHYVVPKDRHIRNKVLGILILTEGLQSICKEMFMQEFHIKTDDEKKQVNLWFKECILMYVYSFAINYQQEYMQEEVVAGQKNLDIDAKSPESDKYEEKMYLQLIKWINARERVALNNNPIYLFLCLLYNNRDEIEKGLLEWKEKKCKREKTGEQIDKMNLFINGLDNIAQNPANTQDDCFAKLAAHIGEDILGNTIRAVDAVNEAIADIAMVSMGNMSIEEYLLLFTKTKRELMLECDASEISTQDVIRVGMVIEFLGKDQESESLHELLRNAKNDFINMFYGLYYGRHKPENKQGHGESVLNEAEKWFGYWKSCFQIYMVGYRIYAAIFAEIRGQMLEIGCGEDKQEKNNKSDGNEWSVYWKKYAETLKNYGGFVRENYMQSDEKKWEEMRESADRKIFDLNIQLVHDFQFQESFSKLNERRSGRIEEKASVPYECMHGLYERLQLQTKKFTMSERNKLPHVWEYEIHDVGQLGEITAEIAEELKRANSRLLDKNEYPIWYRGQQSVDYKLIPGLMRKYKEQKEKQKNPDQFTLLRFIRKKFEEFRFRADGAQEALERVGYKEGDYIALMQHYSAWTHFLDWTEDALSALYFALEGFLDKKAEKTDRNAALYVFSPALYNHARKRLITSITDNRKLVIEKDIVRYTTEGIPNLTVSFNDGKYEMYLLGKKEYGEGNSDPYVTEEEKNRKLVYYLPMAVYVPRLNKRIQTQNGIFLAYNIYASPDQNEEFDYLALEEIQKLYFDRFDGSDEEEVCPFLYKISIEKEQREKIAAWVKAFGMSKEKCYPELSSIGERLTN